MFTTGEFTKIARVTRRTLRHYREIGLFEPVESAFESGYHYYTMEQLPGLNRILALRDLGFSLDQIKEMVRSEVDPAEMRGMLQLRKAEIEQNLLDEQRRIRSIESRLELLEKGVSHYEIVEKSIAPQRFYFAAFLCSSIEHGLEVLEQVNREAGRLVPDKNRGAMMTRMDNDSWDPQGARIEIGYLVKGSVELRERTVSGLDFTEKELPRVELAATLVMSEHADKWHLGTTAIGQWIESNKYRIADLQREVWHTYVPPGPKPPVVELQWPIEPMQG